MASSRYFAYHVDLQGIAVASYELKATQDPTAVSEARHLLKLHPSLEIWRAARFVARLEAETPMGSPT
jgi:hypothetical protein